MKIYSTLKLEAHARINSRGLDLSFRDLENNLLSEKTSSNKLLVQSNDTSINSLTIPNGLVLSDKNGKALSFRETEQGLIIVNRITKLIEFTEKDFTAITIGERND